MKFLGLSQVVIVAVAATLLVNAVTSTASGSTSWTLFHSLDGRTFVPRGRVIPATGDAGGGGDNDSDDEAILKVVPLEDKYAEEFKVDVEHAKIAIQHYGWYHVWLLKNEDDKPNQNPMTVDMQNPVAIATVPSCDIVRANFRDEFTFVLERINSSTQWMIEVRHIWTLSFLVNAFGA